MTREEIDEKIARDLQKLDEKEAPFREIDKALEEHYHREEVYQRREKVDEDIRKINSGEDPLFSREKTATPLTPEEVDKRLEKLEREGAGLEREARKLLEDTAKNQLTELVKSEDFQRGERWNQLPPRRKR